MWQHNRLFLNMLVKILGFIELVGGIVIGAHLLYGMFSLNDVHMAIWFLIIKGGFFTIVSKDFASMVDLVIAAYAIMALYGIFSNAAVTIAMIVWLGQKSFFSLLG